MAAGHSSVFQLVGIPHEYNHIAGAGMVAVVLTVMGLQVRAKLRKSDQYLIPESKISLINISTSIVSAFKGLLDSMIGHGAEVYVPLIGTTFLFILFNNLLGLVPGFLPATDNLNTNLAMALFIFVSYHYLGFKEHGLHYFKQFTGGLPPSGYSKGLTIVLSLIAMLMIAIESIGHVIRPVSLSLRLWGNINGDHTLVSVFNGITPLIVPVVFMALGVFVSVIQALVFSLLSTVYIKLAVSHDH